MELGEIRQQTVIGFLLQEILLQGDIPHPWTNPAEMDPNLRVTQSSSAVYTLRMQVKGPPLDPRPNTHTGRIGGMGTPTKTGLLWVADEPNAASSLEQWAQDYLRQHGITGALGEYVINQAIKKTISIQTTNLPMVRDLLQQSATWPNEHIISQGLHQECRSWSLGYATWTIQHH